MQDTYKLRFILYNVITLCDARYIQTAVYVTAVLSQGKPVNVSYKWQSKDFQVNMTPCQLHTILLPQSSKDFIEPLPYFLNVCVCVCARAQVCICVRACVVRKYVYVRACTSVCVRVCARAYICVCVCARASVYICVCARASIYIYVCAQVYIYICVCVCVCARKCVCVCECVQALPLLQNVFISVSFFKFEFHIIMFQFKVSRHATGTRWQPVQCDATLCLV